MLDMFSGDGNPIICSVTCIQSYLPFYLFLAETTCHFLFTKKCSWWILQYFFSAQDFLCNALCWVKGCWGILSTTIKVLQEQCWRHYQLTGGKL